MKEAQIHNIYIYGKPMKIKLGSQSSEHLSASLFLSMDQIVWQNLMADTSHHSQKEKKCLYLPNPTACQLCSS